MKTGRRLAVMLLAMATLAGSARSAERDWAVGIGGGPLYSQATDGEVLGPSASAWVAAPMQPWFLVGVELGWYRVDGDAGDFRTFTGSWSGFEDRETWTANAVFRAQFPKRVGASPFVAFGTGISRSTGGGVPTPYFGFIPTTEDPGQTETVWNSSIELGLRCSIPGAWPDPEIAVRKVAWMGEFAKSAVQPRLALVW